MAGVSATSHVRRTVASEAAAQMRVARMRRHDRPQRRLLLRRALPQASRRRRTVMGKVWSYYNEFDAAAAAWLRELIKLKAIPDGEVDERSITDVGAEDLTGFTQCHFFAGIAGWPEALRRAGVSADVPLWTGSCHCQSFSSAGKRKGFADSRDLWPVFMRLIADCRPQRVFGEQVAAAIGHGWLDRLHADLEAEGYACGHAVLGAHSAGAPHIRQRLYWLADAAQRGSGTFGSEGRDGTYGTSRIGGSGEPCGLGKSVEPGLEGHAGYGDNGRESGRQCSQQIGPAAASGNACGFWSRARPLRCRDGKTRLVESGVQPLVDVVRRNLGRGGDSRVPMPDDGVTVETANATAEARVMRLRGYGNAICVETAAMFVAAAKGLIGL